MSSPIAEADKANRKEMINIIYYDQQHLLRAVVRPQRSAADYGAPAAKRAGLRPAIRRRGS
jgi:hypothetical protein